MILTFWITILTLTKVPDIHIDTANIWNSSLVSLAHPLQWSHTCSMCWTIRLELLDPGQSVLLHLDKSRLFLFSRTVWSRLFSEGGLRLWPLSVVCLLRRYMGASSWGHQWQPLNSTLAQLRLLKFKARARPRSTRGRIILVEVPKSGLRSDKVRAGLESHHPINCSDCCSSRLVATDEGWRLL